MPNRIGQFIFNRCITTTLLFSILVATAVCQESADEPTRQDETKIIFDASYLLGHDLIKNFRSGRVELDVEQVIRGIRDSVADKEPEMSKEDIAKIMAAFNNLVDKKQQAIFQELADKNMRAGLDFLRKNSTQQNVKELESGLQYKVISKGSGNKPQPRDHVKFHFVGKTIEGKVFQSTHETKRPAIAQVSAIGIRGVSEAIQRMRPGGKWELVVPPNLAFGPSGSAPDIEPNQTLVFEVELLEIVQ